MVLTAPSPAELGVDDGEQSAGSAQFLIKYMGNKRRMLPQLLPCLKGLLPVGGTMLDLFAGTHIVGHALREQGTIWGNDIQAYSAVLGEALLNGQSDSETLSQLRTTRNAAERYFTEAEHAFHSYLSRERAAISLADRDAEASLDRLRCLSDSYKGFIEDDPNDLPRSIRPLVHRVRLGLKTDPPVMAATYWAGTYFSLEQCLWLDAIRQAIEDLPPGDHARPLALASLLHAAARCSSGTGHFAQHRKLTSVSVLTDVLKYRHQSIVDIWERRARLLASSTTKSAYKHRVTCLDYRDLLTMPLDGVDLVYADPPYSGVHYSRFYHLLESLTLYDCPGVECDGRYRPLSMRHQSPFCIKSQTALAFDELCEPVAAANIPLVISYSTSGRVALRRLRGIAGKYFGNVSTALTEQQHNTMGRRDFPFTTVREALLVCLP